MKTLYQCEMCRANYDDAKKALECEAQGVPTNIKVGDIVKKHDGYGWSNGLGYWVIHGAGEHNGMKLVNFYWLVIEIKKNVGSGSGKHCNEVTCVSRGIINGVSVDGKEEWGINRFNHYLDGSFSSNYPVVAEDVPQKVRDEAAAFMARGYTVDLDSKGYLRVTTKKGN